MDEVVLVTGASGYLASWIVQMLLREGLRVHGTVRSLQDLEKVAHLRAMRDDYPEQLQLFEADLLKAGSFDEPMRGCSLVMHTASPYLFGKVDDPERKLLRPALDGTRNLVASVERTPSVRRVVLTSSIVAMYDNAREVVLERGGVVREADVNHRSDLRSNPYAFAKTRAEQWAWEQNRRQQRWSLVSVHPGAIFGPSLSKRVDSTSINMMRQFIDGSYRSGVPKLWLGIVDVRDVAKAHVRAALKGEDGARYLVVSESMRLLDMARSIDAGRFGVIDKLPAREVPKWLIWLVAPLLGMRRGYVSGNVNYPLDFDTRSSREHLKLDYLPPHQTLNDHVAQLLADNLVGG